MITWDLFASPLADRLVGVLLHFTWQAMAVAACLLLVVRAFDLKTAKSKHSASLLAHLAIAALPFVTWVAVAGHQNSVEATGAATLSNFVMEHDSLSSEPVPLVTWRSHLLTAWAGGVALLSIRLLVSAFAVFWLRSASRPLPSVWQAHLSPVLRGLYASTDHLVRISDQVTEAVAVGLIRPLVLLPATWLTELPPDVLRAVLAHELAHLRRGDLWVTLLQRVLETVFFYHPVVWWLSRRLSEEREICCDELAAAVIGDPVAYAQALEQAARQQLAGASPSLAACLFGGDSMALLKRVRHILGMAEGGRQPIGLLAMFGSLLLGVAMLGLTNNPPRAIADEPREEAKDNRRREAAEGKDFVQRGEERRGEDRPAAERREGDRREGERREGERPAVDRREVDRPANRREEARREGDRPAPDGREGARRETPDADRIREREAAEFSRRNAESRELASIVQDLRAEVRQLRAQVAELQERVTQRKGDFVEKARDGAADVKREANERKEQMIREMKERMSKERDAAAKIDDKPRKEGTRELQQKKEMAKPGEKRPETRKEGGRPDEKPRKEVAGKPEPKKEADIKPSKKEAEVRKDGEPTQDKPRKDGEKKQDKPVKEFKSDEQPKVKKETEKPTKESEREDGTPRLDKK